MIEEDPTAKEQFDAFWARIVEQAKQEQEAERRAQHEMYVRLGRSYSKGHGVLKASYDAIWAMQTPQTQDTAMEKGKDPFGQDEQAEPHVQETVVVKPLMTTSMGSITIDLGSTKGTNPVNALSGGYIIIGKEHTTIPVEPEPDAPEQPPVPAHDREMLFWTDKCRTVDRAEMPEEENGMCDMVFEVAAGEWRRCIHKDGHDGHCTPGRWVESAHSVLVYSAQEGQLIPRTFAVASDGTLWMSDNAGPWSVFDALPQVGE